MANKKMTIDSPEFKKISEASEELGVLMTGYLGEKNVCVSHGLAIMAGATIGVIETVCKVVGEDPKKMMEVYIEGLKEGMEEEFINK